MSKISYYLKIVSGMKFKKLNSVINQVNKKTHKNKIFIFIDIIICGILYGAGYNDYNIFAFYNMDHKHRKTYVTRVINKKIISMCNNEKYTYIFNQKNEFNNYFKKYLGRDFLDLKKTNYNKFKTFMKDKNVIFAKPNVGESGKGIEKLYKNKFKTLEEMYKYIMDSKHNFGIIEELIIQHKDMNHLYPLSINSLRIVTLVQNGVAHCVYAVCKTGNGGNYVDNLESGGLFCPIDLKTGKLNGVAHTSKLINYDEHPYTHIKLIGYQIPMVNEAIELAKKAALEIKEVKYIGWDVCITNKGPAIIEGNNYPGYDFSQLPEHTPDKIGLLPYYKKFLPKL